MTTKVCTKCGQSKELDCFGECSGYAGGRRSACKECRRAEARAYAKTEGGRAAQSRYREAHKPPHKPPKPPKPQKMPRKKIAPEDSAEHQRARLGVRLERYFAKHPTYRAEKTRRWYKKNSAALSDAFIRKTLRDDSKANGAAITPELIQLKREQLALHRVVFKAQKLLKEKS